MFNANMPSLSDIAAVTGNDRDGGWGGNGWWIIIILLEGKSRGRYGYVRGLDRYMDDRDGMEMPEWWEMDHMADTDQFDPRRYRMGYTPNRKMMDDKNEKFGTAYREWDVSRRHYHDSNKSEDKEEMNRHAREHIANTLESIRTIWSSSDPELKKRMKADLTALVGELTV